MTNKIVPLDEMKEEVQKWIDFFKTDGNDIRLVKFPKIIGNPIMMKGTSQNLQLTEIETIEVNRNSLELLEYLIKKINKLAGEGLQ